jgi:hypothetical protein
VLGLELALREIFRFSFRAGLMLVLGIKFRLEFGLVFGFRLRLSCIWIRVMVIVRVMLIVLYG